ncbi:hypothetical protein QBC46DRAFT_414610 [Diplogelasinospora grovesii]|uniref:Uncharacterized protein n=1 Tax=Diplogelasinospora grovesii TaxID=303347 RepID=A0AAN6MVC6_9PEZI|nr:hypothetical protein QBC46DRAFT_414610 [Diplogelasinospora grovesii]
MAFVEGRQSAACPASDCVVAGTPCSKEPASRKLREELQTLTTKLLGEQHLPCCLDEKTTQEHHLLGQASDKGSLLDFHNDGQADARELLPSPLLGVFSGSFSPKSSLATYPRPSSTRSKRRKSRPQLRIDTKSATKMMAPENTRLEKQMQSRSADIPAQAEHGGTDFTVEAGIAQEEVSSNGTSSLQTTVRLDSDEEAGSMGVSSLDISSSTRRNPAGRPKIIEYISPESLKAEIHCPASPRKPTCTSKRTRIVKGSKVSEMVR